MNKWLLPIFTGMSLSGCVLQPQLAFNDDTAWKNYGYETALSGMIKNSEDDLRSRDKMKSLQATGYQAYSDGYELGRTEYCTQNAFILGVKNQAYHGICDRLDWTFRQDYISGRTSRAGRSF
ncbi:DUF2799 domain-containing protein [Photobacterium sanguinicancri]|uniref:DUF2799 domain-containing protein n=1 Tax=Photobacterium sanguinicancri TaxID=875932 RepID=A0AAW7YAC8_9GAMM|nr:DUF2799 domain-containing protein [Photobacterium sanguinicancri]MDO6544661.1 DUF2799 domain-containing protein [Photobacterium sanguinicancri]